MKSSVGFAHSVVPFADQPYSQRSRLHWLGLLSPAHGLCQPGSLCQEADRRLCQPDLHARNPSQSCLAALFLSPPKRGQRLGGERDPQTTPLLVSVWLWCECVSGCKHLGIHACVRRHVQVCACVESMCMSAFAHTAMYQYGLMQSVCTYKCV